MLADLYPMRRKLKNFWMHPNENLCRSLDLFGQDVYHNRTMLPPRETMLGSNLCKRTLQRCLCTNLPQFRRYSGRPNSPGEVFVRGIRDASLFGAASGSFSLSTDSTSWESAMPSGSSSARYKLSLNLAGGNNTFGSASTVQPSALRTLVLIRAY